MRTNHLTIAAMTIVVAIAFLLEQAIPSMPWYAFLALPIVAGIALIPLSKSVAKKRGESIGDERTARHSREASYIVFRTAFPVTMGAGMAIIMSGADDKLVLGIGYALLVTGIALGISFGAIYTIIAARN